MSEGGPPAAVETARPAVRQSESSYYDAGVLGLGVGVHFNGIERTNVEEYCVSGLGAARR